MIGQFPATVEPSPLSGSLSDGILDDLCKFCGQCFDILLFVGCLLYFNRMTDDQCPSNSIFSQDEHGQDRGACLEREEGRSGRGEGPLAEEWNRNPSAPLLLIRHQVKDLISAEAVEGFFNGSGNRFW